MKYNSMIDFSVEEVPVIFEVKLGNAVYLMGINYNDNFDYFTIDLYKLDKTPIILAEKLILNQPLFEGMVDDRLPAPVIIPSNTANIEERVNKLNFGKTVFLYIDDGGGN
ncbi:phage baseplate plug protein [Carnobacterium sp. FSL E2-0243]|uniref:phage baseplate plug family protein n=1 Tax=Carnobacterium TaxID=2747 RepID=UPI0030FCDC1D